MGLLRFFLQILDLTLTILGDPGAVSRAGLKRPNRRVCSQASEYLSVVSSSLYFWKSVFSFRVDSGCLYTRLVSKT